MISKVHLHYICYVVLSASFLLKYKPDERFLLQEQCARLHMKAS